MKKYKQFFIFLIYGILAIALSFATIHFIIIPHDVVINWWLENPMNILVNAIPIFLGLVLVHSLVTRVQVPIILISLFVVLLAFINQQKIIYRSEPLYFGDFVLFKEAINIVLSGSFPKEMIFFVVGIVAIAIILMIFTPFGKYELSIKTRGVMLVLTLGAWAILVNTVYTKDFDENVVQRPESNVSMAQTFNDKGIIYSLVRYRDFNTMKKPDTFLKDEVEEIARDFEEELPDIKPDIIMIMGEAWTRVSEWENFQFHEGMDPFIPLEDIWNESFAKGNLYTPVFGGGTSNTEYDALTSHCSVFLSKTNLTAFSAIRKEKDSIARVLSDIGYNTYALHPGHNWFYNREKVYNLLGFEEEVFFEDFQDPEMKGGFISERETYNRLIKDIGNLQNEEEPYFSFLVTIQNHGPYNWYKHQEAFNRFDSKRELSDEIKSGYENYFEGIYDMNLQVSRLCEYLENTDRPTMVIYFGDHHPFIGTSWQSLQEIGFDVEDGDYKRMAPAFNTGFFMWGNKAFMENAYIDKDYPEFISANFLVPTYLSSFGGEKIDPFLYYSYNLSKELPVLHRHFFFRNDQDVDAHRYQELTKEEEYKLNIYKSWEYMRGK